MLKYKAANTGIAHSIFRRLYNQKVRDAFTNWRRKINHQIEFDSKNSRNIEVENE
jgi:hypothetical protein